ncbi:hypothetical protein B0A52_00097 [Exophiala mesophila]|uniref:NmrA-like domain-containing protein n=1 Tax=Exophiala mesophila TaxID=212818 RepID=A0A438NJ36_EXOME|nr:hypothetical protein B0A52_00097 [Exophiala mesophila]
MSGPKVALSGATGNIGAPILKGLLAANLPVLVLTRKGSKSSSKLPKADNLSVAEVDYSSVSDLTAALKGVEVVVSAFASDALGGQNPLIDASVAAGVKRYIPSEYGSNTVNPKVVQLPVSGYKVATQKYLEQAAAKNPGFTYSILLTGPFLDWGLAVGFLLHPAKHSATIYNGGDVPFSTSLLDDIAKGVVGIINHQAETANRAVFIHSAIITQNQVVAYAKEHDGKDWELTQASTEQIRLDGLKKLQDGNVDSSVMFSFISSAIWGEGYGQVFTSLDNDLFGIKTLSEEQLRKLVQSFL